MTRRRIVLAMAALWGCGDNTHLVDSALVVAAAPDLRTSESGGSAMIAVSLSGPPASGRYFQN